MIPVVGRMLGAALFAAIASGQSSAISGSVSVQVLVRHGSPEGVVVVVESRGKGVPEFRDEAVADATGVVRFTGVPVGRVRLNGRKDRLAGRRHLVVGGLENDVHLRLRALDRPYGHAAGVVVDEQGVPVPDAEIIMSPLPGPSGSRRTRLTTTGTDGTFAFSYLGEDNYRVEVTTPTKAAFIDEFRMPAGESLENIRWVAPSEVRVHGTLRGREGLPESRRRWVIRATSLDVGLRFQRVERPVFVSGDRYTVGLTPGRWVLTAGWGDWQGSRVVLGDVVVVGTADVQLDLDLDVPEPVPFAVRVLDGQSAPEPLDVTLLPAFREDPERRRRSYGTWAPGESSVVGPEASARSDSEGWVRFDAVLPGEGRLLLRRGDTLISRWIRVPEDNGLVVDATTTRLNGRIVDEEGKALNRRNRIQVGGNVVQPGCRSHDLACDFYIIDGDFTTPSLQAGPTTLHVWMQGRAAVEVDVDVDPQAQPPEPIEIVMPREHSFEADVHFPAKPSFDYVQFVLCPDPECEEPVLDDWVGSRGKGPHRSYEKVPAGDWFLSVWTGFEHVGPIPVTVPGPPATIELTSTVGRVTALVPELYGHDLALELRLFSPDGAAVAITSEHCSGGSLWNGNYGRVVANCVPSGPYRIRVDAKDGRIWEKAIEVRTYQRGETRLRRRHLLRGAL